MTLFWLTVYTGSRLFVAVPLWIWCWWRRPRGMVLWMALAFTWFVVSDFTDGKIARAHGLDSRAGFWLDHLADLFVVLAFALTAFGGSREPARRRARAASLGRSLPGVGEPPDGPRPPPVSREGPGPGGD